MAVFALVDGNSFYCSCERAFDPRLREKPVVVLSNNDGCVIARTAEAKAMGIKMGEPFHLMMKEPRMRGVRWYSSNYALYADMSRRMYEVLSGYSPEVEPYSIDEMFMNLEGFTRPLHEIGVHVRQAVLESAKIPTCVGIGPTKTIAKLANRHAKQSPDLNGVCDLTDRATRAELFRKFPVGDVWGIGPAAANKLARHGVETVAQFLSMPLALVRQELTVTGGRIHEELKGNSCLPLSMMSATKKGLAVTRSFGSPVKDRMTMVKAIATFAARAAEKLREEGLVAGHMSVFVRTSDFGTGKKYGNQASVRIEAGSDSLAFVATATHLANSIWKEGFDYAKGGVMLNDISRRQDVAPDLFPSRNPATSGKLMEALDVVNAKYGRGALRPALVAATGGWKQRQGNLSDRYTTDYDGLMRVKT